MIGVGMRRVTKSNGSISDKISDITAYAYRIVISIDNSSRCLGNGLIWIEEKSSYVGRDGTAIW